MSDPQNFAIPVTTHLEKPLYFRVARAAKALNVAEGAVVAELVRRGLDKTTRVRRTREGRRHRWTDADDATLRARHAERQSFTAIAAEIGTSTSVVSKHAAGLGLVAHFRGRPPKGTAA